MAEQEVLLEVRDLCKNFKVRSRKIGERAQLLHALSHVNLKVYRGETLGVIGESGCGKSTLGRCIVGLHTPSSGQLVFEGSLSTSRRGRAGQGPAAEDPDDLPGPLLLPGPPQDLRQDRGGAHDHPQDRHRQRPAAGAGAGAHERGGPGRPARPPLPHEFSGGQRQRINIARALSLNPDLLVCDEPVSALDVSIQAQVLNLFGRLQEEFGLTYVFISHDLSVIKHISDRIAIMYLGQVVELCGAEGIYDNPLHPYTRALLSAVPPSSPFEEKKTIELKGDIPSPIGDQVGCPLASRCPHCTDRCRQECPSLKEQEPGHQVACFLYES
ncbi:MAG: oligopeptide/dipeptide ABC transporter ATP-binding protein [Intestinimonas sp.]